MKKRINTISDFQEVGEMGKQLNILLMEFWVRSSKILGETKAEKLRKADRAITEIRCAIENKMFEDFQLENTTENLNIIFGKEKGMESMKKKEEKKEFIWNYTSQEPKDGEKIAAIICKDEKTGTIIVGKYCECGTDGKREFLADVEDVKFRFDFEKEVAFWATWEDFAKKIAEV